MRALLLAVSVLIILAGCGHRPEKPEVKLVYVKVKEPCIDKAPAKPSYKFGKGAKPSEKDMAYLLSKDFEAADQYGKKWEAVSAGCLIVKSQPSP